MSRKSILGNTALALSLLLAVGPAGAREDAAPAKRCVPQSLVAAPVVRDDGRLYFRGQPDRRQSYIVVFKGGECPGLNRFSIVAIETTGAGYCEGDKVQSRTTPTQIPGPRCVIDHLQPSAGDLDDPIPPDPAR